MPFAHQAILIESPVFVSKSAEPCPFRVVPFIGKPHGDPVAREGPQFFDEPVLVFSVPLPGQEFDDRLATLQEFVSIPPPAVRCVRECE
jgi:hypothetical protein